MDFLPKSELRVKVLQYLRGNCRDVIIIPNALGRIEMTLVKTTPHWEGELYPEPNTIGQRRFILTLLHKNCGGQVLRAPGWSWKTEGLRQDGTIGCCSCHKQPISDNDTYEDYC